jgi:hypothetical protein
VVDLGIHLETHLTGNCNDKNRCTLACRRLTPQFSDGGALPPAARARVHNDNDALAARTRRRITVRCNCLLGGWHNALAPWLQAVMGDVAGRRYSREEC